MASNWIFHKPAVSNPWRAARTLANQKQRQILKWLLFPPTEPVRRILARIPPEALSIKNLLYLRDALSRKDVVRALSHVRRINAGVIRLVTDPQYLPLTSPRLLSEVGQDCQQDVKTPPAALLLRDTLRMADLLHRPVLVPFASLCRLRNVHDQLALDFAQDQSSAVSRPMPTVLPDPPFKGTENIVPLCTPEELRREGAEMKNCVFSYIFNVADSQEYIYRVLAPVRGTLSIRKNGEYWTAGQYVKNHNGKVPDKVRQEVYFTLFKSARTDEHAQEPEDPRQMAFLDELYVPHR